MIGEYFCGNCINTYTTWAVFDDVILQLVSDWLVCLRETADWITTMFVATWHHKHCQVQSVAKLHLVLSAFVWSPTFENFDSSLSMGVVTLSVRQACVQIS